MSKIPYFPFYPDDWLSSSRIDLLTADQERGYLRLLARSWNMPECVLPDNEAMLLKWSRMASPDDLRALCKRSADGMHPLFEKVRGGWRNPKLYSLWLKAQERHETAVKNANARYQKEDKPAMAGQAQCSGTANQNQNQNQNQKEPKTFSSDSNEVRLSGLLLSLMLVRKPDLKKPDIQSWAKSIDLMIRVDKRTPDDIEAVIRWCQADSFWQNNILSTSKLREKFDALGFKMKQTAHGAGRQGKPLSASGQELKVIR